jgi:hypothetical protein
MTNEPALARLNRLVGTWTIDVTHPALPGVVAHGTAVVEWLEGERFLIHRARTDHPDFPDSVSIIGITDHVPEPPGFLTKPKWQAITKKMKCSMERTPLSCGVCSIVGVIRDPTG